MYLDLETHIVFLLFQHSGKVSYDLIVNSLEPDLTELEKALKSLLSDSLIAEDDEEGRRIITVNMNDEDYRQFFTQEVIEKLYGGDPVPMFAEMVMTSSQDELARMKEILNRR